jgi:hypothetical protein
MFHYHNNQQRRLQAAYLAAGLQPYESAACGCNKSTNNRDKVQQSAVTI